jgi:hypothetical protein
MPITIAPKEISTMKNKMLFYTTIFAWLIIFAGSSYSIDWNSLADQSSYRCSGGIVAVGDSDREVRKKCGAPLKIARRQDFGPIWIYYEDQDNFMYYLPFLNGKLQRIVGAPCSPDDADCLDVDDT